MAAYLVHYRTGDSAKARELTVAINSWTENTGSRLGLKPGPYMVARVGPPDNERTIVIASRRVLSVQPFDEIAEAE